MIRTWAVHVSDCGASAAFLLAAPDAYTARVRGIQLADDHGATGRYRKAYVTLLAEYPGSPRVGINAARLDAWHAWEDLGLPCRATAVDNLLRQHLHDPALQAAIERQEREDPTWHAPDEPLEVR